MRKQSSKERPSLELKRGAIDPEAGRDSLWSIVDYEVTESGNFEVDSQCQQQPGTVLPDSRHQIHKFPTVQKANSSFSNFCTSGFAKTNNLSVTPLFQTQPSGCPSISHR